LSRRFAALALALLALVLPSLALAQYTDDEDLEDQKRRDEEYLKRYTKPKDAAPDPAATEAEIRERFLAAADELIRDKNYRSTQSARYRIQTDDPRLDVDAVSGLLEDFAAFFEESWPTRAPSPAEPTRVFLFYSYYKYNQLLGGGFSRQEVRPAGHYGAALGALAAHSDPEGARGLPDTLVHEAAHERIDRLLYTGIVGPSVWVTEGLATYFENTARDAAGKFEPGVVGPKQVSLVRGAPPATKTDAKARLARTRQALAKSGSETPLVLLLVSADQPAEFYGPGVLERYDLAWVLVHFLLHGDEGRYRDGFVRFVALDAAGQGTVEALERETQLDFRKLDPVLADYVKSIRVK